MSKLSRDVVMETLATVVDPDLGTDIVSLDRVEDLDVATDGEVRLRMLARSPLDPTEDAVCKAVETALSALPGVAQVHLSRGLQVGASNLPRSERLPTVRNIIGVGSGKGGVGKSTVAVNIAVTLAQAGASVGLLDADVYGPSVPIMMGLADRRPQVTPDQKIVPLQAHGVRFMSMGLLVKREDAVVWRGPMIGRAVTQFVDDVQWGELDYLIVDLPPGTGDVVLSLSQTIPLSGAIVVSTPQDVAFADVIRAIRMFQMLKLDLLGLVENMAYFLCPDNGKRYAIFGDGRLSEQCKERDIELLGSLPLDMAVAPSADRGTPIAIAEPDSEQARLYREIAGRVAKRQAAINHQRVKPSGHDAFFANAPGRQPG